MTFCTGDEVIVTLRGGYPIPGVIKNFVSGWSLYRAGRVMGANVLVTRDAGLYRTGDVIPVPVDALEAVA